MNTETPQSKEPGLRELCIAIDPHGISRASLNTAIILAERFKIGLFGLFISDDRLHRVAQLPFTTEVVISTGEERELLAEAVELVNQRSLMAIRNLFEQIALPQKQRFRLEVSSAGLSLRLLLENRQDLFLPARKKRFRTANQQSLEPLKRVKWVYDGSEACERARLLLLELVHAGMTQEVLLLPRCAAPRQTLAELSRAGARIYWLEYAGGTELAQQLKTPPHGDLLLLPASSVDGLGERDLQEINLISTSAVLVVA